MRLKKRIQRSSRKFSRLTVGGLFFWLAGLTFPVHAQTIPNAPTNLLATTLSVTRIDLSWTDTSTNEDGFKIERSTDGTNFTQIAQVLAATTAFHDSGKFPGTIYCYRVRAYNTGGDSGFSNIASVRTLDFCSPQTAIVAWGANYYGQTNLPAGISGVVGIAAGRDFSLALKSDGTVVGWGYPGDGAITPPAGLTSVVAVAAGLYHSLALKSDGTVVGWGGNGQGEATPPAGLSGVVAIAGGGLYSLALTSNGTVLGWGWNDQGRATPPEGLNGVVAIAAGGSHGLALKSDGTVVGWGDNTYGQATPPAGLTGVVAIAAGSAHSLALRSDGTVVGWGSSFAGESTPPAGLTGVVAVAASDYYSLALKSDGLVVGWGNNFYGQSTPPARLTGVAAIAAGGNHGLALGLILNPPSNLIAMAASSNQINLAWSSNGSSDGFKIQRAPDNNGVPGAWAQIAAVDSNTTNYSDVGLASDSTYWYRVQSFDRCDESSFSNLASMMPPSGPSSPSGLTATGFSASKIDLSWTDNSDNETGFKIERSIDGTNFIQIAQVSANTTTFHDLSVWPNTLYYYRVRANRFVSNSDFTTVASAVSQTSCLSGVAIWGMNANSSTILPTGLVGVVRVAAGYDFGLAVMSNETVVDWGGIGFGTPPAGLTGVVSIAAHYYHSLALIRDGSVVVWGDNSYGMGTPPPGLTNVTAIATGWWHNLALKSDGTVVGWGENFSGQATAPASLSNAVAIAAGYFHSLALKADGTVVGWGQNDHGQETPPAGLSNVVAVAAGSYHSLAVKSDGTVVGWGDNAYGQATPPAGLSGVVAVAAGERHSLALKSDGTVVGWGYNADGEMPPTGLTEATAIGAGDWMGLAVICLPDAPSALGAAAVSSNQINLAWTDNADNENGFKIERALDSNGSPGTWAQIATVGANTNYYTDITAAGGTVYWYRVRAYKVGADSAYSGAAIAITPSAPPFGLTATAVSTSQINLAWTDNSNVEDSFKIERALDSGGSPDSWSQIAVVTSNVTTAGDTGLMDATKYWYRVRAHDFSGDSAYSSPTSATTQVAAPSNLTAATVSANQINLSWADNSGGEDGFQIYRATTPFDQNWIQIATNGTNVTTYIDTGLACGQTYYYRVRAYKAQTSSAYSNIANANTGALDTDSDGLPDCWTLQYFGHAAGQASDKSRANDDADGDGMSNLAEFLAGVDPTNSASVFRIISILPVNNDVRITWGLGVGRTSVVQAASSLLGVYFNISPGIVTSAKGGAVATYLDRGAVTNAASRFYRIALWTSSGRDINAPTLTINSPADNSIITNKVINVAGTSADTSGVAGVMVNNIAASSTNGYSNWAALVNGLADGTNTLTVIAGDNAAPANMATATVHVVCATGAFDGNGDGLADGWQIKYFGAANAPGSGPSDDPDGDGQNNRAEFITGTDPTNSASTFRILSVRPENADLRITWAGAGGRTNILQAASNLAGSFSDIGSNVLVVGDGDTATNQLDSGAATNAPARFYRVRLVP